MTSKGLWLGTQGWEKILSKNFSLSFPPSPSFLHPPSLSLCLSLLSLMFLLNTAFFRNCWFVHYTSLSLPPEAELPTPCLWSAEQGSGKQSSPTLLGNDSPHLQSPHFSLHSLSSVTPRHPHSRLAINLGRKPRAGDTEALRWRGIGLTSGRLHSSLNIDTL